VGEGEDERSKMTDCVAGAGGCIVGALYAAEVGVASQELNPVGTERGTTVGLSTSSEW